MPKATRNCAHCEKEFSYYQSSFPNRMYCSNACKHEATAQETHITTTCPACGVEFWYHRGWTRKYCSRVCASRDTVAINLSVIPLEMKYCKQCGNPIDKTTRQARDTFCSRKCFGVWRSIHIRGENHPTFVEKVPCTCAGCGKQFNRNPSLARNKEQFCSFACRRKRIQVECEMCHTVFERKAFEKDIARFCSRECKHQWMAEHGPRGPEHHSWLGGYAPYYGPNWRNQRRNARRRDGYACQRCGVTEAELSEQLSVHHIKPFRMFQDDHRAANAVSNLVCLCRVCHTYVEHHGWP